MAQRGRRASGHRARRLRPGEDLAAAPAGPHPARRAACVLPVLVELRSLEKAPTLDELLAAAPGPAGRGGRQPGQAPVHDPQRPAGAALRRLRRAGTPGGVRQRGRLSADPAGVGDRAREGGAHQPDAALPVHRPGPHRPRRTGRDHGREQGRRARGFLRTRRSGNSSPTSTTATPPAPAHGSTCSPTSRTCSAWRATRGCWPLSRPWTRIGCAPSSSEEGRISAAELYQEIVDFWLVGEADGNATAGACRPSMNRNGCMPARRSP